MATTHSCIRIAPRRAGSATIAEPYRSPVNGACERPGTTTGGHVRRTILRTAVAVVTAGLTLTACGSSDGGSSGGGGSDAATAAAAGGLGGGGGLGKGGEGGGAPNALPLPPPRGGYQEKRQTLAGEKGTKNNN